MDLTKNRKTLLLLSFMTIIIILLFSITKLDVSASAGTSAGFEDSFNQFFDDYKLMMGGFLGASLITSIGIFIYHFCRLGATASNPQKRAETLDNIMMTAVCTALLGIVPFIIILLSWITSS